MWVVCVVFDFFVGIIKLKLSYQEICVLWPRGPGLWEGSEMCLLSLNTPRTPCVQSRSWSPSLGSGFAFCPSKALNLKCLQACLPLKQTVNRPKSPVFKLHTPNVWGFSFRQTSTTGVLFILCVGCHSLYVLSVDAHYFRYGYA